MPQPWRSGGELLGEDHPDYANSLNNLAALYRELGEFARAETTYREALEIREEGVGRAPPRLRHGAEQPGLLYQYKGDYAHAEPLYRQVLAIYNKALGGSTPTTPAPSTTWPGFTDIWATTPAAEPMLPPGACDHEEGLGLENHPDLYAASLNNLGTLYQDMGDYARAEPLLRRALEIRKKAVGEDHPDYAISLNSLAELYLAMGEAATSTADPTGTADQEKVGGRRPPPLRHEPESARHPLLKSGDYALAEPLIRLALEIRKKALGEENHSDYAAA